MKKLGAIIDGAILAVLCILVAAIGLPLLKLYEAMKR